MSSEIAIRVDGASKCYHIYDRPQDRLKQALWRGRRQYFHEFWALRDVSFEIRRGETVGIIGRNGSGKSTLLQMICGTLMPTTGRIEVNGRVAALLELGAGFNPEFSGRENVYMNASILGLSKTGIDERYDDIVAFADIGDFIGQPVKTYSSGMFVRLAFAVIAHVDADILLIDEALAVGDVFFQQKCMRYLREFQERNGSILFVSHDMAAVSALCQRGLLLSRENDQPILRRGSAQEICQAYLGEIYASRTTVKTKNTDSDLDSRLIDGERRVLPMRKKVEIKGVDQEENRFHVSPFRCEAESFGAGGAKIEDVWFADQDGRRLEFVVGDRPTRLLMRVSVQQKIVWPAFGFMLKDRLGQYVIAEGTDRSFRQYALDLERGDVVEIEFSFTMPILIEGEYTLNVAVAEGIGDEHQQHHWAHDAICLTSLGSRLVHGICGLSALDIRMRIESVNLECAK